MKDFSAQAFIVLQPLLLALLSALVVWASTAIRKHVHNKLAASAFEAIVSTAATVVASASQTVVEDLKNPERPGTWDDNQAALVKAHVMRDLKQLAAKPIEELKSLRSLDAESVQKLLDRLVESQVGQLKPKPPSTIVVVAGQEEEEIPTKLLS